MNKNSFLSEKIERSIITFSIIGILDKVFLRFRFYDTVNNIRGLYSEEAQNDDCVGSGRKEGVKNPKGGRDAYGGCEGAGRLRKIEKIGQRPVGFGRRI